MKKQLLTPYQKTLYFYLKNYIQEQGFSPTLQEIRLALGIKFLNSVVQRLNSLEEKGYIRRTEHVERNIELKKIDNSNSITWTIVIPVVSSVGCDNLNVIAHEDHDEFVHVDSKLIGDRKDVIAVRAVGDSMNDADIHDGDYILIEPTEHAQPGDRIAAIIGDLVTVKKYDRQKDFVILRPESKDPKYKPIILRDDFKIAGKVICAIPKNTGDATEVIPIKNLSR